MSTAISSGSRPTSCATATGVTSVIREYVGAYRYILRRAGDSFRIKERRVLIDAHELGALGSVSFIL